MILINKKMNIIICGWSGDRSCGFDLIITTDYSLSTSSGSEGFSFSLNVSDVFEKQQQHKHRLLIYKN